MSEHRTPTALRIDRKATHQDTRNQNRRFVLQRIFTDPPTTRADIARATGLTRATVSDLVAELVEEGLVAETGTAPSLGGKPPTLLSVADDVHHLVTVDLSGDPWTASVMSLKHRVVETAEVASDGRRGAPAVEALSDFVAGIVARSETSVLGVGVATPGIVTPGGTLIEATDLDWHGVGVGSLLAERLGLPVHVINDSRAIALAEYSLGDHGTDNLFVVKVGTGIGAGIVLDGRLYSGEGFAAGEIGHLAVLSDEGNTDRGVTLEEVASARAIARELGYETGRGSLASRQVFLRTAAEVDGGSGDARRVVERAGRSLGIILAAVTGTLDIHHIVVTGPAQNLGDLVLDAARTELPQRILPAVAPRIEIEFGSIANAAERGAAMLVLNREMGIL